MRLKDAFSFSYEKINELKVHLFLLIIIIKYFHYLFSKEDFLIEVILFKPIGINCAFPKLDLL